MLSQRVFLISCMMVSLFPRASWAEEEKTRPETAPFMEMQDLFPKMGAPKIVVAKDGTVLAFSGASRWVRRSEDQGRTWSPQQVVGPKAKGNVVVDDNSGDVLVVCRHGHLYRSKDNGKTWVEEAIVIKPNAAGHGKPDGLQAGLAYSESGITLKVGKHKGRLLVPARIIPPLNNNDQQWWPYHYNTAIYSDDGGKTWQTSGPVQSGTGEGTLAELSNGKIYYNSRSHMSVDNRRRIAWSHNGGHMWTDWEVSNDLYEVGQPAYFKYGTKPSYGCAAGLVRMPSEVTGGKDVLLFSTPDNPGGRRVRMTVWASFDGAKTWPIKRLVYKGGCAYSSLSAGPDGTIYLLFERDGKGKSALARFNLEWLTQRQDWRSLLKN